MAPEKGDYLLPKRSLGQNFLVDRNIARKVVNAVGAGTEDVVVEIGPGHGSLTRLLVGTVRRLIVVELDARAVAFLQKEFPGGSVEIVHQDFLQFDLGGIAGDEGTIVRVLGNIPYNITSPILFHLLANRQSVKNATLMVQREVARRVIAAPGSKEYGIPSVLCQYFAVVRKLFDVPPTVFVPKPDVWSSVIQIEPRAEPSFPARSEDFFRAMVRATFGQRRKMLRHSLRNFLDADLPDIGDEISLRRRPESLSVEELVHLSNLLYDRRNVVKGS